MRGRRPCLCAGEADAAAEPCTRKEADGNRSNGFTNPPPKKSKLERLSGEPLLPLPAATHAGSYPKTFSRFSCNGATGLQDGVEPPIQQDYPLEYTWRRPVDASSLRRDLGDVAGFMTLHKCETTTSYNVFMMLSQPAVSHELLAAALQGLESQKVTIEAHIAQVRSLLGNGAKRRGRPPKNAQATEAPEPKRRHFSAATRRKMAAAQKRRYAALRGETETTAAAKQVAVPPKKRTMSAAGRERIADAARKRWAAIKKAKNAA
jgi:hypothetical protein